MIEPSLFEKHRCDTASLKKLFSEKRTKRKPGIEKLNTLLRDRIRIGRERALNDHLIWAAVDMAYDTPLGQTTPTFIRHILSTCRNDNPAKDFASLEAAVKSWGLRESDLFCRVEDKNKPGTYNLGLNPPIINGVVIPIMRAYLNIRLAKLFNDRNKNPLFDYQPQHDTDENRVQCEIVTGEVQEMNLAFNYAKDLRQNIFNTLVYSQSLQFPVEPWYAEYQLDADGEKKIEKEGVRYVQPHITRTFSDLQFSPSTLNTDTGCSFAGYWGINRWGDVEADKRFWNMEQVGYGFNWLSKDAPWANYFKQVYPCTMELPVVGSSQSTSREALADYYGQTDHDRAVFLSYSFIKIIPKDYDIGTYPYEVWFKFTVASDDCVIYGEPFSYSPVKCALYDTDQNRGRNASLALELIPFQDEISNLINQINSSIKRNLTSIVFVNEKALGGMSAVESLNARSNQQTGSSLFVPYDAFKSRVANSGRDQPAGQLFDEVKLAYANTAEQFQSLATMINLTERIIGVSAQEVGSAASHQQGKTEIELISGSSTNRVQYTGSFIDEFIYAWKKQLWEAIRAHKSRELVAQVSSDIPDLQKHLDAIGFKIEGKLNGGKKTLVRGKKDKLKFEAFASNQNAPDVEGDREAGQAMFNGLASINNNQRLASTLEIKSLVDLYEVAAKKLGAGKRFDLKIDPKALTGEELKSAIEEVAKIVSEKVGQEIGRPAANALAEQEKKIETTEQQINQILQLMEKFQQRTDALEAAAVGALPIQPPTQAPINELSPIPIDPAPPGLAEGMALQPSP